MESNRRDFLKVTGVGSLGLVGSGFLSSCTNRAEAESSLHHIEEQANRQYTPQFNMHGFNAPESVIAPLSEWSVANSGRPINVPNFTAGTGKPTGA